MFWKTYHVWRKGQIEHIMWWLKYTHSDKSTFSWKFEYYRYFPRYSCQFSQYWRDYHCVMRSILYSDQWQFCCKNLQFETIELLNKISSLNYVEIVTQILYLHLKHLNIVLAPELLAQQKKALFCS